MTREIVTSRHSPIRASDHRMLAESLDAIEPVAAELLVSTFYDQLFTDHPHLRPMFPLDLDLQRDRLLKAILALVAHYEHPTRLLPALAAMGRNHARYGVQLDHYAAVGATLIATLRRIAGVAWTPAYEAAWRRAYTFAAGAMMVQAAEVASSDADLSRA